MKARNKIILLIFCLFAFFLININISFADDSSTQEAETQEYITETYYTLEVPFGNTYYVMSFADYLLKIYTFSINIITVLGVVVLMFGGMRWAASAGNEQSITSAKEMITGALVGLVIALGSYAILARINPELVSLQSTAIPKIKAGTPSSSSLQCLWAAGPSNGQILSTDASLCEGEPPTVMTDSVGYDCYCNLRENIVKVARESIAQQHLSYDCCWGWANTVYNLAGGDISFSKPDYIHTLDENCKPCNYEDAHLCVDSNNIPPYETIEPGDWLYIFNGHYADSTCSQGSGEHSVIFLDWYDEASLIANTASATAGVGAKEKKYDFNETPVTQIFKAKVRTRPLDEDPGNCA